MTRHSDKQMPSAEQVKALRDWAALYGRNWKSPLRDAWMNGDYRGFADSHFLQQVRNTFGPSWLVRFTLTDDSWGVMAPDRTVIQL